MPISVHRGCRELPSHLSRTLPTLRQLSPVSRWGLTKRGAKVAVRISETWGVMCGDPLKPKEALSSGQRQAKESK
jgi:hypothetical protein